MSSPLLLIPGFMCNASLWQALQPGLAALGPVHFADISAGSSIEDMADSLLAGLPDDCSVIGFSMGGYVARQLCTLAPEKIRRLVLLNSSARATSEQEIQRNRQQIRMLQTIPYRGQTRAALQRAVWPQHRDNEAILDHLQSMSLQLGRDVFLRQMAIVRSDGHEALSQIRCPALIVASREDQMRTPEEAYAMHDSLPGSELVMLEQCGHMSVLEQPATVLTHLQRFWQHS